ncbi:hypothetical protein L1887_56035 [Cichorium endivia]|nr:hypothetical protein L1887_56035 [Cichorium endivia]
MSQLACGADSAHKLTYPVEARRKMRFSGPDPRPVRSLADLLDTVEGSFAGFDASLAAPQCEIFGQVARHILTAVFADALTLIASSSSFLRSVCMVRTVTELGEIDRDQQPHGDFKMRDCSADRSHIDTAKIQRRQKQSCARLLDTSARSELAAVLLVGIVAVGLGNQEEGDDGTQNRHTEEDPEDALVAKRRRASKVRKQQRRQDSTALSACCAEAVSRSSYASREGLRRDDEGA